MNKLIYIFNDITDWQCTGALVYCYLHVQRHQTGVISVTVNRAQNNEQYRTKKSYIWGGSNSALCMLDWNYRLLNRGTIIQHLWTDRSSYPLVCSVVSTKDTEVKMTAFMSGLSVFCCLRSVYRRTVVLSWIMWTIVTRGAIRTYSSSIYVNTNWAFLFVHKEIGWCGRRFPCPFRPALRPSQPPVQWV